jgi:hypothetical protein
VPVSNFFRTAAFGLACALFGSLLTGAAFAAYYQENMVNARSSARQAIAYLDRANADKGGHRNSAINYLNRAIYEINAGINYANRYGYPQ